MASRFEEEGDLSVLRAIGERAEILSQGGTSPHRPWLLVLGGGIRGIYGAAAATQLEACALTEGFVGCVGVSTGAPTCAYFLSKQGALGTTFYYEECVGREFFSLLHMLRGGSGVDVSFLARAMRGEVGLKQLDQRRVRASRTEFFVAVTDAKSGQGELIDAKKAAPDIVQALEASLALPSFYRKPVFLGDKRFIDGGVGLVFPVKEMIERFRPTHLLILANRPRTLASPLWYRALSAFLSIFMPPYIKKFSSDYYSEKDFLSELEYLRASSLPYLILWTDDQVSSLAQNKKAIRQGMAAARSHMRSLLERAGL